VGRWEVSPGTVTRMTAAASKKDRQNCPDSDQLNHSGLVIRRMTHLCSFPSRLTGDGESLDLGQYPRRDNLMESSEVCIDLLQEEGVQLVNLLGLRRDG
jgi:hypothetical protein